MKRTDHQCDLQRAVLEIKTAILRCRYLAMRLANVEMLKLYYGIGEYVANASRVGKWGTGAIAEISSRLQQELPGLRGFSESNIKSMRLFFETWCVVGGKSAKRQLATADLPIVGNEPGIRQLTTAEFARAAFGTVPKEDPSIGLVLCREANRAFVEMAVRDMSKPMGVAVFRSDKRMPRVYRSLQPMLDGMVSVFEDGMK